MTPAWLPVNERRRQPERLDGHGQQRHRDALARGQQHVQLAARRQRRDLLREVEELVGGVAHRADDHADVVAGLAGRDDALGDPLDALGVGHGRATVLLHDQAHGCQPTGARTGHGRSPPATGQAGGEPARPRQCCRDRSVRPSPSRPPAAPVRSPRCCCRPCCALARRRRPRRRPTLPVGFAAAHRRPGARHRPRWPSCRTGAGWSRRQPGQLRVLSPGGGLVAAPALDLAGAAPAPTASAACSASPSTPRVATQRLGLPVLDPAHRVDLPDRARHRAPRSTGCPASRSSATGSTRPASGCSPTASRRRGAHDAGDLAITADGLLLRVGRRRRCASSTRRSRCAGLNGNARRLRRAARQGAAAHPHRRRPGRQPVRRLRAPLHPPLGPRAGHRARARRPSAYRAAQPLPDGGAARAPARSGSTTSARRRGRRSTRCGAAPTTAGTSARAPTRRGATTRPVPAGRRHRPGARVRPHRRLRVDHRRRLRARRGLRRGPPRRVPVTPTTSAARSSSGVADGQRADLPVRPRAAAARSTSPSARRRGPALYFLSYADGGSGAPRRADERSARRRSPRCSATAHRARDPARCASTAPRRTTPTAATASCSGAGRSATARPPRRPSPQVDHAYAGTRPRDRCPARRRHHRDRLGARPARAWRRASAAPVVTIAGTTPDARYAVGDRPLLQRVGARRRRTARSTRRPCAGPCCCTTAPPRATHTHPRESGDRRGTRGRGSRPRRT